MSRPLRQLAGCMSLAFGLTALGCSIGPSIPAGPIAGPGIKVSNTWGYSYTPVHGSEQATETDATEALTLNGGYYVTPIAPMHTSLRASAATWLDVGYDVSFLDHAFQLRGGPLDAKRTLPFGLQLEYRASDFAEYRDREDTRIWSARLEAYPHLFERTALRGYVVGALGVSHGNQLFAVNEMPERFHYDTEDHYGNASNGPEVEFHRKETRLEAFIGAHLRFDPGMLTLVLAPHLVVGHEPVEACAACAQYFPANAEHDWGIALLVSPGFVWEADSSKPSEDEHEELW